MIKDKPPKYFAKFNSETQIPESCNIIIRNIPFNMDVEKLQSIFEHIGSIRKCRVITDDEGNSRGFGFVDFDSIDSAKEALKKNGEKYGGRPINV